MDELLTKIVWLQGSIFLYNLLMQAYPAPFRKEYGAHMLQAFQDSCRAALIQRRQVGIITLWADTLVDFVASIVEQYAHLDVEMTREKFLGMSGWAFILGTLGLGGLLVASGLDENLIRGVCGAVLVGFSMFLLSVGIGGFYARYAPLVRWLGKVGLLLSVLGGGASTLASVLIFLLEDGPWWNIWILSMGVMFGFLALFGLEAICLHPMKRGNILPLLAGIWFPLMLLAEGIYQEATGQWLELNDLVNGVLWVMIFTPMLLLGYVVFNDRPAAQPNG